MRLAEPIRVAACGTQDSLYQRAMGSDFERLAPALQRFHSLSGDCRLQGMVQTEAPQGWIARILARTLGTPLQTSQGPIRFELRAAPHEECWVRHFPQQSMRSVLRLEQGRLIERLGLARLDFELTERKGELRMALCGLRFLGLPCPGWLCPEVLAEERGDGDRLHFHVRARLPGLGQVVAYQGHLELPKP
ncbi:DUF4166 domain-containing protein [Roseateles cavernae]|uniref:DUF4166 domain-containing protein n=1 Tax=Roseateles cavernae TaxID=3153578 RepID=UPI0032E4FA32